MDIEQANEVLLKYGKNPIAKGAYNEDFLHACKDGHIDLVEAYLTLGVDIDFKSTEYGESVGIIRATEGNHVNVVKFLAEKGANLELLDSDGDTALHTAVNWGHKNVVKALLEMGAQPDNRNKNDLTPITGAIKHHHSDILKVLYDYSDPNKYFETRTSFLHTCIEDDDESNFKSAFSKFKIKPDLSLKDDKGENLLVYLIHRCHNESSSMLDLILKNRINPNETDQFGWIPFYAAKLQGFDTKKLEKVSDLSIGKDIYEMFEAVKTKDILKINSILDKNVSINSLNYEGKSLLAYAIGLEIDDQNFYNAIIGKGIDLNLRDYRGCSLAELAYEEKKYELGHFFIEKGVSPNNQDGICDLFSTIMYDKNLDEIEYLCKNGANLNELKQIHSPIVWGDLTEKYILDLINIFGKYKANLSVKDDYDTMLGALCAYKNNIKIITALLDNGCDVNILNKNHQTPFYNLADSYKKDKNTAKVAKLLMERGASFDIEGEFGGMVGNTIYKNYTPHWELIETTTTFLKSQIDQVLKNHNLSDWTRLTDSCKKDIVASQSYGKFLCWIHIDKQNSTPETRNILKTLIQNGIPVNAPELKQYDTPLSLAIVNQDLELVTWLLEAGADPNYVMKYGSRTVAYAIYPSDTGKDYLAILEAVLKAGAKVDYLEDNGGSAIGSAIAKGELRALELLMKYGADLKPIENTLFVDTITKGLDFVKWAINAGVNKLARNRDGYNALMLAIEKDKDDIVNYLLELDFPINEQNTEGKTALLLAVQKDNIEVVKMLLEKGADPEIKDNTGTSPKALAAYRPSIATLLGGEAIASLEEGKTVWEDCPLSELHRAVYYRDINLVDDLIKAGADINEKNYRGDNALMIAILTNQDDIANLLFARGASHLQENDFKETAYSYTLVFGYPFDSLKEKMEKREKSISMDAINAQAGMMMNLDAYTKAMNTKNIIAVLNLFRERRIDLLAVRPGTFPLCEAVKANDYGMVKGLLELGALPDMEDDNLDNALYYAEDLGYEDILELLKQY